MSGAGVQPKDHVPPSPGHVLITTGGDLQPWAAPIPSFLFFKEIVIFPFYRVLKG